MQNRLLIWITLIVLFLSLGACNPADTEPVATESIAGETAQQNPTQDTAAEQAYPVETPVKPAAQAESAYPITQDDLGQLIQVWTLTAVTVDGSAQEAAEKTLAFTSGNTFQIITSDNTITGNWTAQLLATESNLILSSSEGTLFSYQITSLEADSLVLTSIQDGKPLEEHFAPANW